MSALQVRVAGIGLYAPGLPDWPQGARVLRGEAPHDATPPPRPAPPLLPAAERRRAPETVLYAAQVAAEACAQAGLQPDALPCVFSSVQGDLAITDYMCATLATAPQELSPTRFHNSVHNAAAGYWSIATGCRAPATALSAFIHSFGAGLLEAAVQVQDSQSPVLLISYDTAAVGPLRSAVPFDSAFATALLLAPDGAGAQLTLSAAAPQAMPAVQTGGAADGWMAGLRAANASAAALDLLHALANHEPVETLISAGPDFLLRVQVQP
jgi:Beta-ketoacyl synthase, N-terminal domain